MSTPAPILISLPDGLSISGVTTWALRLAGPLAARGRAVIIIAHGEPAREALPTCTLPYGVELVRLQSRPLRAPGADLSHAILAYRDTLRDLVRRTGRPAVYLPMLVGDAFGIGAALSIVDPESIRMIGWQHADVPYDTRVLSHYEPAITSFACVSRHTHDTLAAAIPHRHADITHLPNAVPVGHAPPERPAPGSTAGRPLRLVYTGRLEHKQKRVTTLVAISDELHRRGTPHTLSIVGDGPARGELDAAVSQGRSGRIRLTGPLTPDAVRAELRASDVFVLPSRYEGLSVSMLEAMAEACIPVVADVASGSSEAIIDGYNGGLVRVAHGDDDNDVAIAFADAVARILSADAREIGLAAWRTVRNSYALDRFARSAEALIDRAAESAPRPWPATRPCAFSTADLAAPGTVPHDAPTRLAALLHRLAGSRVLIHGAGSHTTSLAGVLAASPAVIVGVTDDDPARWGSSFLGWKVSPPSRAAATGATDVVVSSWIHADDIFARRGVYEHQGLRVHHLYREHRATELVSYSSAACSS